MKINLAKSAGFCSGVKRALQIAFSEAKKAGKTYMLGDIVHNEDVVRDVKKAGIKKVKMLAYGEGKTLIVRAHGAPKKIYSLAKTLKYKIVDATCPMVKEIHNIAKKSEAAGYKIIVIGDEKHDEVRGIIGQLKTKAIVISDIGSIDCKKLKKLKKAAVVVQSTQNIDKVLEIVERLRKHIKKLKFYNTVCLPTKTKQNEIKKMPLENDVMIIIGSKTSANTKRLYQISKTLNKNSFWISKSAELKKEWFKKVSTVGITAGASTPDYITREVIKAIKKTKPKSS